MPEITERQSNTPEQMQQYLDTALGIMEQSVIPSDLREVAFSKLCDWAANKTMQLEPTALERAMLGSG